MAKLILMRHGQSAWNEKNLFTGWVDVPLSQKGIDESLAGGERIRDLPIDVIYSSSLLRAHMTAALAMVRHASGKVPVFLHPGQGKLESWAEIYSASAKEGVVPVHMAWELNERYYGRLQGLDKAETAEQYGADQVQRWRRSYHEAPPEGESLAMTAERAVPFFQKKIFSHLEKGESVFVAAHGNSLRAIVMHIEGLSEEQVLKLELATGEPRVYSFEKGRLFQ